MARKSSKGRAATRDARPWTPFEMDVFLALLCKGIHRVSRDYDQSIAMMRLTEKLNQAVYPPRGSRDSHPDDRDVDEVTALYKTVAEDKKAALSLIERSFPSRLTRTKKRVFERNLGFLGSPEEWVKRREGETARQWAMHRRFVERREIGEQKRIMGLYDDLYDDHTQIGHPDARRNVATPRQDQEDETRNTVRPNASTNLGADDAPGQGLLTALDTPGTPWMGGFVQGPPADEHVPTGMRSFEPALNGPAMLTTSYQTPSASGWGGSFEDHSLSRKVGTCQQGDLGASTYGLTPADAFLAGGEAPFNQTEQPFYQSATSPMWGAFTPGISGVSEGFLGADYGPLLPPMSQYQEVGDGSVAPAMGATLQDPLARDGIPHEGDVTFLPPTTPYYQAETAARQPHHPQQDHRPQIASGPNAANAQISAPPDDAYAPRSTSVGESASWMVDSNAEVDSANYVHPDRRRFNDAWH